MGERGRKILCEGAKRMEELRIEREHKDKEDVKMEGNKKINEDKEEEWRDIRRLNKMKEEYKVRQYQS